MNAWRSGVRIGAVNPWSTMWTTIVDSRLPRDDDDDYVPVHIIKIISRRRNDDNVRQCAIKRSSWISPPVGFEAGPDDPNSSFERWAAERCVKQGRSRMISKGFNLITLPQLLYVFGQTGLSKQCRPRSDATERGVWSGSALFATHPAILHSFTQVVKWTLKRNIR